MNRALVILFVIVIILLCVFCLPMASTLISLEEFQTLSITLTPISPDNVAEAVATKIKGLSKEDESYYWTASEINFPTKDCFVDGGHTIGVKLFVSPGYHWESRKLYNDGAIQYCVKKNKK